MKEAHSSVMHAFCNRLLSTVVFEKPASSGWDIVDLSSAMFGSSISLVPISK